MAEPRERGILNERERQYLRGETDIEPKSADERAIRSSIRQHLRDSILDFVLVFEELEERDAAQLFEQNRAALASFISAQAFVYEFAQRFGWDFEELLSMAIEEVYTNPRARPETGERVADVSFGLETEQPDPKAAVLERAEQKFENGNVLSLTDRELRILVEFGTLGAKELVERYRAAAQEQRVEESRREWGQRIEQERSMLESDSE